MMRHCARLLCIVLLAAGCGGGVSPGGGSDLAYASLDGIARKVAAEEKAIYGDDDRRETYEVDDPDMLRNVRATVALLSKNSAVPSQTEWKLAGDTLGVQQRLCPNERFHDQPAVAFCTGFLIASDLIATAAHCLVSPEQHQVLVAFDYELGGPGAMPLAIPASSLYHGTQVVARRLKRGGEDWAIVRLDREVLDREPVQLSRTPIAEGTPLYLVGHPSGLPKKVAPMGYVFHNEAPSHFVTNLDSFQGNSGSMVVNWRTHEVEGILVRGSVDFVGSKCTRALRCPRDPQRGGGADCGGGAGRRRGSVPAGLEER